MIKFVEKIRLAALVSLGKKAQMTKKTLIFKAKPAILPKNLGNLGLASMLLFFLFAPACSSVKGYEKMYLNDAEMDLAAQKVEKFEISFQTYREGASGATGGKSGGGCGCN